MGDISRLRADAALIDVGSWISHRTVRVGDEVTGKVLGVVCAVEHRTAVDDDGEITDVVVYRYRHPNGRDPYNVAVIGGDDIDPTAAHLASPLDAWRLACRVCFEVGRSKSRTGIAREQGPRELSALLDAVAVLVSVVT